MLGLDGWEDRAFSEEELEDPAVVLGPPVSIRSLKSALRRRRRLWLAMAFVGLVLGASLHMVLPSKVTAVSKVYVVEPAGEDPTAAIANDISLLETRRVAQTAASSLHLNPNGSLVKFQGSSEGDSIVAIKVTAASGTEALDWNNALADAFLKVRAQFLTNVTGSNVAPLNNEILGLQANMQQLSSGTFKNAATRIEIDQEQINQDKHQITAEIGSQNSAIGNSAVLDYAYLTLPAVKKTAIKDGLSGLVAGLGLGITIVIVMELMSDRVRTRADVASALGAPVDLSVGQIS